MTDKAAERSREHKTRECPRAPLPRPPLLLDFQRRWGSLHYTMYLLASIHACYLSQLLRSAGWMRWRCVGPTPGRQARRRTDASPTTLPVRAAGAAFSTQTYTHARAADSSGTVTRRGDLEIILVLWCVIIWTPV